MILSLPLSPRRCCRSGSAGENSLDSAKRRTISCCPRERIPLFRLLPLPLSTQTVSQRVHSWSPVLSLSLLHSSSRSLPSLLSIALSRSVSLARLLQWKGGRLHSLHDFGTGTRVTRTTAAGTVIACLSRMKVLLHLPFFSRLEITNRETRSIQVPGLLSESLSFAWLKGAAVTCRREVDASMHPRIERH